MEVNNGWKKIGVIASIIIVVIIIMTNVVGFGKLQQKVDSREDVLERIMANVEGSEARISVCESNISEMKSKVDNTHELVKMLVEKELGKQAVEGVINKVK